MTLLELLEAVKDEHLGKAQLEKYRDAMTHLHSEFQIELADIEKREAIFFEKTKREATEKISDVSIERTWAVTADGQRQIELNRYIKTVAKEIDSLKSRLYSIY